MKAILIILLFFNIAIAKKVALVIGNSNYNQGRLANPVRDANLIAQKLKAVGFKVMLKKDISTVDKMKDAINSFVKDLKNNDIAVVYYAGHGVQCLGENYLVPTKANIVRGPQLKSEALNLNFLINSVSGIKLSVIMLDACRDNKYPSCSKSQSRGLAQVDTPTGGMIISYATAPNQIALDGNGNHSPYAKAIAKYITQPIPIETFFRKVGKEVLKITGTQHPMLKNSFYDEFSFGGDIASTNNIQKPNNTNKKHTYGGEGDVYIQVASFARDIPQFYKKVKNIGFKYKVESINGYYRVYVGPFKSEKEANSVLDIVKSKISSTAFVKKIIYVNNRKKHKKTHILKFNNKHKAKILRTTYMHVNIYKEPNTNSDVILSLSRNSQVYFVYNGDDSKWIKVRSLSGKVGWVERKRVK